MAGKKPRFLIFDGHAILHRAWHALPPLTNRQGTVVSGAYGFTSTFLKAIREFEPAYVAVTFDLEGPTFRHEEYEDYKGTREEQPDELYAQIPIIEEILALMNVPVVTAKGMEADDVIGTLSKLANEERDDVETIIVTGDLDALQLVDARTKVYTMRKGMSDTVLYDIKAVKERYGLKPSQMIDYKALRGDPSDNIPGVKGVGEKTATDLISTFGSLEKLYDAIENEKKAADDLRASVKEKLITHKADALQAQDLVRIRRDVKVDFSLQNAEYEPVTQDTVLPLFEELQFMRLLNQLPKKLKPKDATIGLFGDVQKDDVGKTDTTVINDAGALDTALTRLKKSAHVAFRTITETEDPITPEIIAFGIGNDAHQYILRGDLCRSVMPALKAFFDAYEGTLVCHDLKRETNILFAFGIGISSQVVDLMIASYLLHSGERRHGLDTMLAFHRSVPRPDKKLDTEGMIARLGEEMPHLVPLAKELMDALKEEELVSLYDDIEIPLSVVLAHMERTGIAIDAKHFAVLSKELGKKIDTLTKRIYTTAGTEFNINSPAQLKEILFDKMDISTKGIKKTQKGGGLSTAASELEKLKGNNPIIADVLEYRELSKLRSTYVDAIPPLAHLKTGRIHASFNQTVTATGRLSSSDPNLQNIPTAGTAYGKEVRNGFIAPDGFTLVAADYSQIELRLAAHIAHEKVMIDAFLAGDDIHSRTAAVMFGEEQAKEHRRVAKVINFGILYGMGATRLSEAANVSFAEAREYIDRYFSIHTGIAQYVENMKEMVREKGYVETLFGRRRFFRNFDLMNQREQAEAERQAVNMPLQGTQADLIKVAMVRLDQELQTRYGDDGPVRVVVQVHDELVLEVKNGLEDEVIALLVPIMENVLKLDVPVLVDVAKGDRWGEMKKD